MCVTLSALGAMLGGCASGPNANPHDPMEPFNRGVFAFNDGVDRAVLKPVATAYRQVLPQPVRSGVGNFFANLEDAWSAANSLLQFKAQGAADNALRFGVNTFFGFAGLIDIASDLGIERHPEDFGKTLGRWGVSPGPFVMLPLLGPSTLRDSLALPVDYRFDIVSNIEHVPTRNTLKVINLVDTRSSLLNATAVIEGAALDKYSFTRDAYLQVRRNAVYDGNPPEEDAPTKAPAK
jgi:phospholipid-binding lipoprotein MlaA